MQNDSFYTNNIDDIDNMDEVASFKSHSLFCSHVLYLFYVCMSIKGLGFLDPMLPPFQARQLGRDFTKSVGSKT